MVCFEFGEILEGIEYRDREAVYGLVFNHEGQIGVIQTPRGYFLPGGGIEVGENHVQCIQRKFLEETGYSIEIDDYIGCGVLNGFAPKMNAYLKMIGYFYKVKLIEKVLTPVEVDHAFMWMDQGEASKAMKLENQAWAIRSLN